MDGLASLPVNLSDTNRCSLIGGKYLLPSWAVIPGRIPKSHEVQLATTDAGSSRILSSRDGSRALLLLRPEGPATSGDSMAVAFNTLLPTRDRGPRCVIQLSRTVMEIHEPQSLGVSSTGDSDEGWYRVGEATLGDWLDDLDPAADLGGIPTPLVVKCTTHTVDSWRNRTRADDNDILSYAASKMYWAWRFELDGAHFSGADCLRLRTTASGIERVLVLEEGTSWTRGTTESDSLLFRPTPSFLRSQREKRMLGHEGSKVGLDHALGAPRYSGVRAHLSKSQQFLIQDPPDLANSAKEAICAVEALARLACNDQTATLGDLIKVLKSKHGLDPALVKALEGVWGYTSNAPAVRHGGTAALDVAQAQVILDLARSSIVYLLRADTG